MKEAFMYRIKRVKAPKKLAVVLIVVLINSCVVSAKVEASWLSDALGGLFTFITAPIWVFCPDNPTFRKNNPFRKKPWEEITFQEGENDKNDNLIKELQKEIKSLRNETKAQYQGGMSSIAALEEVVNNQEKMIGKYMYANTHNQSNLAQEQSEDTLKRIRSFEILAKISLQTILICVCKFLDTKFTANVPMRIVIAVFTNFGIITTFNNFIKILGGRKND
jgi:hypothetical protein